MTSNEGKGGPPTSGTVSSPNINKRATFMALETSVGSREQEKKDVIARIPSPEDPLLRLTLSPPSATANLEGGSNRDETSEKKLLEDGDEEEDDESSSSGIRTHARKKLRLSREQSSFLEQVFTDHTTPTSKQKSTLARHLKLRPRQVEVWFQNRRARTKLKQTEVDCQFWRHRCVMLSEENRRLSRELYHLKRLKITSPFHSYTPPHATLSNRSSINPFTLQILPH